MKPQKYCKITLCCSLELEDILANYLTERGASGIVFGNNLESGEQTLTAYFGGEFPQPPTTAEIDSYFQSIREHFPGAVYRFLSAEWLHEEDWLEGWKKNFKPLKVSQHIVIRPTWEDYEAAPDEIVIVIDPKMAFGTGHHETTAQCLRALEEIGCFGKRMLDYGCGTGILAIAAAKMGASIVAACDNDPEAILASKENAVLNDVVLFVEAAERFVMSPPVEIITANMITDQLINLYDCLDKSLQAGGLIVFSGISNEDYRRFDAFISRKPYYVEKIYSGAEWTTLICRKSG